MGELKLPLYYSIVNEKFDLLLELLFLKKKPTKEQIKNLVIKASDLFTFSESKRRSDYLSNPELLKGYLLYFTPVNLSKIASVLSEMAMHPEIFKKKELKIIDIGSGLAPSLIALFELIERGKLSINYIRYIGVESQENTIDIASKLVEKFKPKGINLKFDFLRKDSAKREIYLELKAIKPDLVIFSNSLGEIIEGGNLKIEDFPELIKPLTYKNSDFNLLIIEPATKKASMRLHKVRDLLIEKLELYPYSPCLNSLPCAALKAKNWCYEERRWTPPEYLSFLKSVGLQLNFLKFSYVVMRKDGLNLRDVFGHSEEVLKNTSHLLNEKGKSRLWACWKGNLVDVEKLKRDFEEDEPMLKIRKGSYFVVDEFLKISEKKFRIPKSSNIKILYFPDRENL